MCLYFPSTSSCYSGEQTIVICSAKHQRHTVSFKGSSLGHSHERKRLSWSECDSQGAWSQMRWESLRSPHQGASKCPEKQKSLFKDRDGSGSKGPSQWVPPTPQPVNSASPEAMSEGVMTHPFTRKDTDFFSSPKNVGLGYESPPSSLPCSPLSPALETWWGVEGSLTHRFESFDLLKMLMGKRRTPGNFKMLTWLGMCLNPCRAMWHIYQAISRSCWVSLKMQTSTWDPGHHESCV